MIAVTPMPRRNLSGSGGNPPPARNTVALTPLLHVGCRAVGERARLAELPSLMDSCWSMTAGRWWRRTLVWECGNQYP